MLEVKLTLEKNNTKCIFLIENGKTEAKEFQEKMQKLLKG